MPSTLSRSMRHWVRLYLVERDGPKCSQCGRDPGPEGRLDIDHRDGNPTNHTPSNLRLLCRSCNTINAVRRRQGIGTLWEREGELGQGSVLPSTDPTVLLKSKVNYSSGSPEMQVNDEAETEFRNWAVALLIGKGEYPVEDLIADGAERTGASVNAIRNYLKKLCSPSYGSLETFKFAGRGRTHIKIKAQLRKAISNGDRTPTEVAQRPREGSL